MDVDDYLQELTKTMFTLTIRTLNLSKDILLPADILVWVFKRLSIMTGNGG